MQIFIDLQFQFKNFQINNFPSICISLLFTYTIAQFNFYANFPIIEWI